MRPMVTLHTLFSASEHPIPVAGHCYMGLVAVVSAHSCGRPEFFQLRDACSTLKRMLRGKEGMTQQIGADFWRCRQVERIYHNKVEKAWVKGD